MRCMRRVLALVVVLAVEGSAGADEDYPITMVDRPIVMPCGMTTLDVAVDFSQREPWMFDLAVAHTFRSVELRARLVGPSISASALIALGDPRRVLTLSARTHFSAPPVYRYYVGESLGYGQRYVVVPHWFSIGGGVSVSALHRALEMPTATDGAGSYLSAGGGAGADLQLTRSVDVSAGAGLGVPLAHSHSVPAAELTTSAHAQLAYAFQRWDFYAWVEVVNLTTTVDAYASVGALHRFY